MTTASFDPTAIAVYDEGLYRPDAVASLLGGFAAVGDDEIATYRATGLLPFSAAFSAEVVEDARSGLLRLVGDTPDGVELQFEALADRNLVNLPVEERQDHVRKLMNFGHAEPRLAALRDDPAMLGVIEKLLGAKPEVYQEMALFKPPGIGREKPWHQDHAYFAVPEGTPVVGVWIALDPATVENGCMIFLPGAHREGPRPHFVRRDWQLCDDAILEKKGKLAVPLPTGGAVLFDGLLPHGTGMNRSTTRRRAVQYHYVPKGTPRIRRGEEREIFGEHRFQASC